MTEQQPITFFITFHVDPSKVDEFFTHFRPLYEKVIAEPELRCFHVYQDDENPGKIMLVETW
jgi:quinol monooxygenase YgiN